MGLLDKKVSEAMLQSGVVGAPDKLTGTAAQNKAVFDRLMRDVVGACINPVLEELAGSGGAAAVGAVVEGMAADDVQGVLAALKRLSDERYSKTEALAVMEGIANPLLRDVTLDESGVWTFTRRDGSTVVYDTKLEKVVVNFKLEGDFLVLEHDDGTTERVSLAAFRDHHGFADSETVSWTYTGEENDRVFTAVVRPHSITLELLAAEAVAKLDADVQAARESALAAQASKAAAQAGAADAAACAARALADKNAAEAFVGQALESKNAAGVSAAAGAGSAARALEEARRAESEADRAKREADRANQIVGGDFVTKVELSVGVAEAKGYTDSKATDAKEYTDEGIAVAKEYTDVKNAETLQSAKEYADPAGSAAAVGERVTALEGAFKAVSCGTATLAVSGWTGDAAPFVQTVSVAGVTEDAAQVVEVGIAASASVEQREAARLAMLFATGKAAGQIIVTADGDKPTVSLPLEIVVIG